MNKPDLFYRRLSNLLIRILAAILFLIIILVLTPANSVKADTVIKCGNISANETWISTNVYVLTCNVNILNGITLIIESGTVVKFQSTGTTLTVNGILDVQGTSDNQVVFTSYKDDAYGGDTNGDGGATSPAPGDWQSIIIANNANVFDYSIVQYGGYHFTSDGAVEINSSSMITNNIIRYNANNAIYVSSGTPTISNNIITDNTKGLYVYGGSPVVQDNSFSNSTSWHLVHYPSATPSYSGNSFSGTGGGGILVDQGSIFSGDITWNNLQNLNWPYVVTGIVTVSNGATLRLPAGTVLKFQSTGTTLTVNGILDVQGTSDNQVVFTSYKDDAYGGDTNGDGGATSPAPGDWQSIIIANNANVFDYSIVQYGGYHFTSDGAVEINSSSMITNNIIRYNANNAIYVSSGTPTISNNIITDNTKGLYVYGGSPVVQDNSFSNSTSWHLVHYPSATPSYSGNSFSGTGGGGILVDQGSIFSGDITWNNLQNLNWPYVVTGIVTVSNGATLRLPAGTVLKFQSTGTTLTVNGILDVQGTSDNQVVFTSYKDDAYGGDTNGDGGATSPAPGDWQSIIIANNANVFDYSIVQYGGYHFTSDGAVEINSSSMITNNIIRYNANNAIYVSSGTPTINTNQIIDNNYGVYINNGDPIITNNDIFDNTSYGIYRNATPSINAENNWWGDASGPYHPILNPNGTGDRVSDNVTFTPWLTEPVFDTIPPATITDLSVNTGSQIGEIDLTWTAPGDDGNIGTASAYIVRYNNIPILNETDWNNATDVDGEPIPGDPGTIEHMSAGGFVPGQQFYLAIRTIDDANNLSGISNSPAATARSEDDKSSAYTASANLTAAGNREIDQIQTNIVSVIVDAVSSGILENAKKILNLDTKITDLSKSVGDSLQGYDGRLSASWIFLNVKELVKDATRPAINYLVGNDLQRTRDSLINNQLAFDDFVNTHQITWYPQYWAIEYNYWDSIASRYETEPVGSVGTRFPYLYTGTLEEGVNNYGILMIVAQVIGILLIVILVAAIVLSCAASAGVTLGGSIPIILAAIPGLLSFLKSAKSLLTAVGIFAALCIFAAGEFITAPSVAREQEEAFTTFETLLPQARGSSFDQFETSAHVNGNVISISTNIHNTSSILANPLVQTYIYSADGHVVDILSHEKSISPNGNLSFTDEIHLQPGKYKIISLAHSKDKVGLAASNISYIEIQSSQVEIQAKLEKDQLVEGQPIQATITVTNITTGTTTDLVLVTWIQEEGQQPSTWEFSLDYGEQREFTFEGVPNNPGAGIVDIAVSDGGHTANTITVPFIVGEGISLAANLKPEEIYQPGSDIIVPIKVISAGTIVADATISLSTYDPENISEPIYTREYATSVAPDSEQIVNATWLPNATPERYITDIYLNGDLVGRFEYIVEAVDTYYGITYPDQAKHNTNDNVQLNFEVLDSSYAYVNVPITATVSLPDGNIQPLTLSQVETGRYQSTYIPNLQGTYWINAYITAPEKRVIVEKSYFYANEHTSLLANYSGSLILNSLSTITVTVVTDQALPVDGANVALYGTNQKAVSLTDKNGMVVLSVKPDLLENYQLTVSKDGYDGAVTEISVEQLPDTTPPPLILVAPEAANTTQLNIHGVTEVGVDLLVDDMPIEIDSSGYFTAEVNLVEGNNLIEAKATDQADNVTITNTEIILDTTPPVLTITSPIDGAHIVGRTVDVIGYSELGSIISVNGIEKIYSSPGDFNTWLLLENGPNAITITATDKAGNHSDIVLTIYSIQVAEYIQYLPLVRR